MLAYRVCSVEFQIHITGELYDVSERHLRHNVTDVLGFLRNFPSSILSLDVVIAESARGAVFYNVTLQGLTTPLQAYTAHLKPTKCSGAGQCCHARTAAQILRFCECQLSEKGTLAKLHVPWANEHVCVRAE